MPEITPAEKTSLPAIAERDLSAMHRLMAEKEYQIKGPFSILRQDRLEKVSPDFVSYTLNDHLGHLQRCVASTRKMLPTAEDRGFYQSLEASLPLAYRFCSVVFSIDIRQLGLMLGSLQKRPQEVSIMDLVPFTELLYHSLIRVYYLGEQGVSQLYKILYQYIVKEHRSGDQNEVRSFAENAIEEWRYIFARVFTGLYPLVLRMCSPVMLTMQQLYYANGSRILAWLRLSSSDILILREGDLERMSVVESVPEPVLAPQQEIIASAKAVPQEVQKGLDLLERLFPKAGWDSLDKMPDMCPYFQPILQFQDAFMQLAPDNPLQLTLILFRILEEMFQGLRLIKFEPLPATSSRDDVEDINRILEDWILYQESVFDKNFSVDFKAYTHQIYTQPDYNKSPYGRKLLSNMYTLIKHTYLPWFDIRMFGTAKVQKDDRLPPFFIRVTRLKRLLVRYSFSIETAPHGSELNPEGSVVGIHNPWAPYKFDVSNPVSRRLDAICGGKHSKTKTNALLIQHTLSILMVLDWWINNKESYAYRNAPEYLYRVIEPGSAVPAFGVSMRNDVETLFIQSLKGMSSAP